MNDGFPENICLVCSTRFKVAIDIKTQAQSSFSKLKLLKKSSSSRNQTYIITSDGSLMESVVSIESDDCPEPKSNSLNEETTLVTIIPFVDSIKHDNVSAKKPVIINGRPPTRQRSNSKKNTSPSESNEIVVATPTTAGNCDDDEAVSLMTKIMNTMGKMGKPPLGSDSEKSTKQMKSTTKKINPNKNDKRQHSCAICDKWFLKKSNLEAHMRIHLNMKDHVCKVCGKSFIQVGNYVAHLRVHTKERPFCCILCPKSYTQSSALTVHVRSHTQEKNFICKTCTKAFTNSSDLRKHELVHTGVKKFSCNKCAKKFTQNANMKKHERRCTIDIPPRTVEVKKFSCMKCGLKFMQKGLLQKHERVCRNELDKLETYEIVFENVYENVKIEEDV